MAAKKAKKSTKKSTKKSVSKKGKKSDTGKKRGKVGKPPFEPTEVDRQQVESMVGLGLTLHDIATLIINPKTQKGISVNTLQKHFADEIASGAAKVQSVVSNSLLKKATSDDHPSSAACAMFIMKCRFGWKQTERIEHEHKGAGVLVAPAGVSPDEWVSQANKDNEGKKPKSSED